MMSNRDLLIRSNGHSLVSPSPGSPDVRLCFASHAPSLVEVTSLARGSWFVAVDSRTTSK